MEETADDESNDIPHSPRASAADDRLAEVEQYLQFLTCLQGLSDLDFRKFMQYSSGFSLIMAPRYAWKTQDCSAEGEEI
jgi:hypothetical protein